MAGKPAQQPTPPTTPSTNQPEPPTPEIVQGVDLFTTHRQANKSKFDISKLKVSKTLSKQLFSIAHSKMLVIKCQSEIYDQKMPMAGRGKEQETDTKLVDIIDLSTGEEGALICNALIVKSFETAGGKLTGRMFAIQEGGIKEGKKYRSIEMVEVTE